MFSRKCLVLALVLLVAACLPAMSTPVADYDNIATQTNYFNPVGANKILADDVHRTTDGAIVSIDYAFQANVDTTATLYIFSNTDDFDLANAKLLGSYDMGTVTAGAWIVPFTLPTPLVAPKDLWIGVAFGADGCGLLTYNAPALGRSDDLWAQGAADKGLFEGPYWYGGSPVGNYGIRTYVEPVPEPSSLIALSTGLVGLLSFRRKRK